MGPLRGALAHLKKRYDLDKIEILLVDDRQENLFSLEAVLACPEYQLVKMPSGDEALRYLLDNTPALILMDVQMPNLNGFETATLIRSSERTREIPIIFITAINKDEKFAHEGYEHGAVDYIYKPFDAQILKAKVAIFAEIRRQHARTARLVAVQQAATQALAEFSNIEDAVPKVLKSICQSLGWDLGTFWKLDRHSQGLRCEAEWHDPTVGSAEFITESFRKVHSKNSRLPENVWSTQTPLWINEVANENNFPRFGAAFQEGLLTAVVLPITVQDETMGLLEFYSRKKMAEDPDLMKIMGAIGSQIGQVLKRAEAYELVRASEAHKAAILDTALDCIISMNQDGKILGFNPAAEKVFKQNKQAVLGRDITETFFPPDHRLVLRRSLKHFLSRGEGPFLNKRIEILAVRSDESTFPAEIAITRVPTVEPPLFTVFLRDITQQKRNEENSAFLIEATATLSLSLHYEQTFSSLAKLAVKSLADWCAIDVVEEGKTPRSVALAHPNPEKLEIANQIQQKYPVNWEAPLGAANVLRTGKSELYTNISDELLEKATQNAEHLAMVQKLGMKSAMVVPLKARDRIFGVITFILSQPSRQYTRDDLMVAEELAQRAAIAIDNAKLYQEAQEAIRARDEFFSIASHELKTPITSLKLLLQMNQRGVNPTTGTVPPVEKLAKMLTTSLKHVDQLTHLVDDLLDVVKIRTGKFSFNFEPLNISDLVKELVERYSSAVAAAKCELELSIEPMIVGLWDRTRIEQVVVNLLSNAVKYAPGAPVKIKVNREGETARIVVQDLGPGIPAELQAKIFDRFERAIVSRKVAGLGLGLFIAKQIVESHNGTIQIKSDQGNGSTFIIDLPLTPINAIQPGGREYAGPSHANTHKLSASAH